MMNDSSELLKRLLASEVKGELLALFHKNPGLIDTLDGVARRIGRMVGIVEPDVKDLIDLGVLRSKPIGRSEVILLNPAKDNEIQATIANYLKSLKEGGDA